MNKIMFLITVVFLFGCNSDRNVEYDLLISNVNLIDGTGNAIQKEVSVGLTNGKIMAIGKGSIGMGKEMIDGTEKYLIPGLFDCHIHTSDYERDFPIYVHYGVTSVFVTGGSLCTDEYYAEMRQRGNQDSIPAPHVFHTSQHFSMEGRHPVKTYKGNWVDGETVFLLKDTLQIEELVKSVSKNPIVGIKLTIEDGPHPPMVERMPQAFINKVQEEATKNGTDVFAHVSDNVELEMALDAGIQNFVHWTGIDIDFQKDTLLLKKLYAIEPSFITTLTIDKGFLYPLFPEWVEAVRQEGIFDEADLEKANDSGYIARSNDNIKFWRYYLQKEDIGLTDIASFQVDDIKKLQKKAINFALGTDTGTFVLPGYSLHEEMLLFELGGMDRMEIIKMATLNAAKMMKAQDSLGSIEIGKMADMVLLDNNPLENIENTLHIHTVIKNGVVQKRLD
ncbi:amidohydrolase family protein [Maribacter sp. PR1]|uniref:Amidohydrolase family protein n=1 Tax=Maribacter cobaltidurans TaxID=1178778 RepID=A0ABU7IUH6_9FLAO|nr:MULTISPECIES: amidohydrolase family protein [Maribacter]MDC6389226.1 amidohydrolase family protein [Maribacter sp. PR1]MEE1976613.1 amidohydrolase family protein [Maribacter cobaltidurans]